MRITVDGRLRLVEAFTVFAVFAVFTVFTVFAVTGRER